MSCSRDKFWCGRAFFAAMAGMATVALAQTQIPGTVKVTTSKVDGERQVQVEPGWLQGEKMTDRPLKLGGFWSDKSPTNFTLEAVLVGETKAEQVRIAIDGIISEFSTTSGRAIISFTDGVKAVQTGSRFIVPLTFLHQMVAGTNVLIQVSDPVGSKAGVFSSDAPTQTRPGFKKALEKIQNVDVTTKPATAPAKDLRN